MYSLAQKLGNADFQRRRNTTLWEVGEGLLPDFSSHSAAPGGPQEASAPTPVVGGMLQPLEALQDHSSQGGEPELTLPCSWCGVSARLGHCLAWNPCSAIYYFSKLLTIPPSLLAVGLLSHRNPTHFPSSWQMIQGSPSSA